MSEQNSKIRIGFIGCGWRAHGYMRIIRELNDRIEVSGVLVHTEKSMIKMEAEYPGKVTSDMDEFLAMGHDYVFLLVPRERVLGYVEILAQRNVPILCETPPGHGVAELNEIWAMKNKYNARIQVAEQYFLQPYHKAVKNIIDQGLLGEISNMTIRMIHDYHGISIFRRIMGKDFEDAAIRGRKFEFPVFGHIGRGGLVKGGTQMVTDHRKRADYIFEDGKTVFFDFSGEQYFNYFRSRHLTVQGTHGEIEDSRVTFMGEDGYPVTAMIERDELGNDSNLEGSGLRSLTFMGHRVYENPYCPGGYRLSDDEIAMAGIMEGMMEYVKTGKEIYPLEEALQDTYLFLMMDKSIEEDAEVVTEHQSWCK